MSRSSQLSICLIACAMPWLLVACGNDPAALLGSARDGAAGSPGADAGTMRDAALSGDAASAVDASTSSDPRFSLEPGTPRLEISADAAPSLTFELREDQLPVAKPQYRVDRPELGTIDQNTGVFVATGLAGRVVIIATSPGGFATTTLTISVNRALSGDPDRAALTNGAGGIGGVGGEGGGTPVTDPAVQAALDATAEVDPALTWLYPYDRTVWPRALPAPLLAWRSANHQALAVRIRVEVDDVFTHTSQLGRPQGLPAGTAFTHVPMPAAAWRTGTESGTSMRVSLVIVAADGAGALRTYRPAQDLTWTIASSGLKGTVYYNSYGTALAKNEGGALGPGDQRFGGAVLGVRGDSYEPRLVAGSTTNDNSGCRVCHTVSGDGSTMLAQRDDTVSSSLYDLRNNAAETPKPGADAGKFAWAALSPDGLVALGASGPPDSGSLNRSALYSVATGATLNAPGFSPTVQRAATPTFSPDGTMLAFNYVSGTAPPSMIADGRSLAVFDVARQAADTYAFSNFRTVYRSPAVLPGWPSFVPGNSGVIFQRELASGTSGHSLQTRLGARGDLWWTDLTGNAHALDNANGVDAPRSSAHPDDQTLNYEPAASPILAGGYAWIIFTSRRLYADIATRPPFESDPRDFDLTPTAAAGPTPKKLWVFAVDVPPTPGSDPSHPAFYLPSQELYAGNSRGFWTPDVCKDVGKGCASGDECCGGFCYSVTEFGDAICNATPPPTACKVKYVTEFGDEICFDSDVENTCAAEFDACKANGDCCSGKGLECIGGRCAVLTVR